MTYREKKDLFLNLCSLSKFQSLLWAEPDKVGILFKQGGEKKSWKKRQFAIKDTFLFYFRALFSVRKSEPAGVIPLQGCKVTTVACGADSVMQNIFVINLPEDLAELRIIKRSNYVLAASDHEDMLSWLDAIKLASVSKHKIQARVDHAYLEVHDLEQRWAIAKERDACRDSGNRTLLTEPVEENPVILQALADDLMDAYDAREKLQNRIKEAQNRYQEASSHLTVLEEAASKKEEMIMEREDLRHLMTNIQAEMATCSESLEWLIPARFQLYTLERKVEALEGSGESGEGVPTDSELEEILRETLRRLDDLEFQQKGDEMLPDEKTIMELTSKLASISAEYMAVLKLARESEHKSGE